MSAVFASRCSHCEKLVSVPEARRSKLVRCVHCQGEFEANPLGAKQSATAVPSRAAMIGFYVLVAVVCVSIFWFLNSRTSPRQDSSLFAPTPIQTPTPPPTPQVPVLEMESFAWVRGEYGQKYLKGTAVNNSSVTLQYAQAEFNLYDKDGNQVGSTMANINNLEAKGRWKFEAIVIEKSAVKAKFKGFSGF